MAPKIEPTEKPTESRMVFLTAIIALATIVNIGVFYFESEVAGKQTAALAKKRAKS